MKKLLFIFGTRPEAIKMAPLIKELEKTNNIKVCTTGQHKEMLQQVMDLFKIHTDYSLDIMTPNQTLSDISANILKKLSPILAQESFDLILVHGDTSTTFSAALSGFYHQIPIAHIEAGLRTHNLYNPWPEEANRQLVSRIATYHFAPTQQAAINLYNEGINNNVIVTGNTVIDALHLVISQIDNSQNVKDEIILNLKKQIPSIDEVLKSRYILVTGHRRENLGEDFKSIFAAIKAIAEANPDINIIYPVHLNPNVKKPAQEFLGQVKNIILIDPLPYLEFVFVLSHAKIIITDSGGIQEEAPSLGIPVLVTRHTTERPEAIDAGTVKLVGTDFQTIFDACDTLLNDEVAYSNMSKAINPYGDGKACIRIADYLHDELN